MTELLLDFGANSNAESEGSFTALMSPAERGNPSAAEKLLRAGADPAIRTNTGMMPKMRLAVTAKRIASKCVICFEKL
jgi:ankyrin repeat protein